MYSKEEVSRLLSKRSLTGAEAGRLILQNCVELDHRRVGLLSPKQARAVTVLLRTQADIAEYNRHVETYRIATFTIQEALGKGYRLAKDVLFWLPDIARLKPADIEQPKFEGKALLDFLAVHTRRTLGAFSSWLAYKAVMEMLSEKMAVNLCEDLEECFRDIEASIKKHNWMLLDKARSISKSPLSMSLVRHRLKTDRLKPDRGWLKFIRDRMALGLGEGWHSSAAPMEEEAHGQE